MARTKVQPAHKSTDGTTPHVPLADPAPAGSVPKKAVPKKQQGRAKTVEQTASSIEWVCPSIPHVADQSLCSGCHNGGDLVFCDLCPLAVCYSLPEDIPRKGCMVIVSDDVGPLHFICPRCHIDNTRHKPGTFDQRGVPYWGFYTREEPLKGFLVDLQHSMLEFFPRLNAKTTVLLQIALDGCEHNNEPFSDTYHHLFGYFGRDEGQLKAASITFDLAHDPHGYEDKVSEAVDLISEPGVERVMVFFIGHNSVGGCIQYSPVRKNARGVILDEGASDEPKRVLGRVFPERLLVALKKIARTTMFFFVCQGADGHPETRKWMLDAEIVSFGAPSLQPDWARGFVSQFGRRFYLESARFPELLPDVLLASPRLGPSTDVFLYAVDPKDAQNVLRRRYYWAQSRCAPYGARLPVRCPQCGYREEAETPGALAVPCDYRVLEDPPVGRSRGEHDIIKRLRKNIFFGGNERVPSVWQSIDLRRITSIISSACQNTVELPVSMERLKKATREKRTKVLSTVALGEVDSPMRLVTSDGYPVLYHLPGIYSRKSQMDMANASISLSPVLGRGDSWRDDRRFVIERPGDVYPHGCENFSAAWFATGQHKKPDPPKPSSSLRKTELHEEAAESWLQSSVVGHQTANILIGILHHESYLHAARDLQALRASSDEETSKWARLWKSVFTAISVIGNRYCDEHTDSKGDLHQFDILLNTGTAENELLLSQLKARIRYDPGTAVVFSGRLFLHEVPPWQVGERVGHAFFMQKEVQIRYNKRSVPYPNPIH
ncbi:hypothetical protein ONZ45_g16001 [Pleurotus djamor]|nr:hypothetical protein ONZ45_g16001 [Pleurotus djamor]